MIVAEKVDANFYKMKTTDADNNVIWHVHHARCKSLSINIDWLHTLNVSHAPQHQDKNQSTRRRVLLYLKGGCNGGGNNKD